MKKIILFAFAIPFGFVLCFTSVYVTLLYMTAQQLPSFIQSRVLQWISDSPHETYFGHEGDSSLPYNGGQVPADGYIGDFSFLCASMSTPIVTDVYGSPRGQYRHSGIDYSCNRDESLPVITPFGGKVVFAGWSQVGYGNLVVIENNGVQVYLAHHSELWVEAGDLVRAGDAVGTCGSTGNSTGPHVHFEVRFWSENSKRFIPADPLGVLLPGQEQFCDWYNLSAP